MKQIEYGNINVTEFEVNITYIKLERCWKYSTRYKWKFHYIKTNLENST